MPKYGSKSFLLLLCFAAVWLIWGSTYLAIRVVLETLPPFLTAGVRFLTAGVILYGIARWRGVVGPSLAQWKSALLMGGLMLLCGNGSVMWAETRIASGPAALLIAIEPLMIVLMQGIIPTGWLLGGLLLGISGVAILVGPAALMGGGALDPLAAAAVIFGGAAWAAGSLIGRHAEMPKSGPLSAGMQMLAGGALLVIAGFLHGDAAAFNPAAVSARSLYALLYLVVFGSIIAFSAYIFLVKEVSPSLVATYAFVNPVVAVILGALLGGEPFTQRLVLASCVIIAGVVIITLKGKREAAPKPAVEAELSTPVCRPNACAITLNEN